jgi:ATP-dependent DNA helicase RecG
VDTFKEDVAYLAEKVGKIDIIILGTPDGLGPENDRALVGILEYLEPLQAKAIMPRGNNHLCRILVKEAAAKHLKTKVYHLGNPGDVLFLTGKELLEMIRNGENSGVEFKRDTIDNRAMAKEIVAFANLAGGYLLLGVDDNGSIVGVTKANLEEWVMNACRDKIRPELIPYFEIIKSVKPGKDIAVVHVDRGWSVHHFWHNNHRTYYIRVGSQSREASPEELERIFQQRGAFRLEIRSVSGTTIDDLDLRRLEDYFSRIRQQEIPGDEDIQGWEMLLVNTDFMAEQNHNRAVTVAGLLLFGKTPYRFLPQASIDAAAYPGKEKDYTAKTRTTLLGPLTPLFSSKGIMESGLVEEAMDFVRRNIDVKTSLEDDVRRKDRWDYPLEAVREGLVNALVTGITCYPAPTSSCQFMRTDWK